MHVGLHHDGVNAFDNMVVVANALTELKREVERRYEIVGESRVVREMLARIEVTADRIDALLGHRDDIVAALTDLGYTYVTLDLKGFRSGSMNETL